MNYLKQKLEKKIRQHFKKWVALHLEEVFTRNKIRYAGQMFSFEEYDNLLTSIFDDWWSGGKHTLEAENKLSKISDRDFSLLVNSGSSANLLLMTAAKQLFFKDKSKIITLSCGFPTTVNPIIQNGMIPVFLDIDIDTLSVNLSLLEEAIKEHKPDGLFFAHTLGFLSPINEILDLCRKYDIQAFFDNCDSYGSVYNGKPIQAYGKGVSYSFYVAHHLSCGEGGGVSTNDQELNNLIRSLRNWGRYCVSPTCCIRAENPELFCPKTKLTKECALPDDYSVNYQFEFIGYNLKLLDMQAAILNAQIDKLPLFTEKRRNNYMQLYDYFCTKSNIFKIWELDDGVSPFSFPLICKSDKFNRKHYMDHLQRRGIETRLLFGGNLTKHPAYKDTDYIIHGDLSNSDTIMESGMMLGVSPVVSEKNITKIVECTNEFLNGFGYK